MSPQKVLSSLLHLPVVAVTSGAVTSRAVDCLHSLQVVGGEVFGAGGFTDEESVVSISGWMLLRLEIRFCKRHNLLFSETGETHLDNVKFNHSRVKSFLIH